MLEELRDVGRKILREEGVIFQEEHAVDAAIEALLDDHLVRPKAAPGPSPLPPPGWNRTFLAVDRRKTLRRRERPIGRKARLKRRPTTGVPIEIDHERLLEHFGNRFHGRASFVTGRADHRSSASRPPP